MMEVRKDEKYEQLKDYKVCKSQELASSLRNKWQDNLLMV